MGGSMNPSSALAAPRVSLALEPQDEHALEGLPAALAAVGVHAITVTRAVLPRSLDDRASPGAALVRTRGSSDEGALVLAETCRLQRPSLRLILVAREPTESQQRWAAALTPFSYREPISPGVLASCVERCLRRRG